jgi:Phosphate-selective porin O and P
VGIVALVAGMAVPPAARAQWEIKTEDGKSIKFGFLAVMRADQEELANGENAQNLYFRRFRILMGGKLAEKWSFFFETDSPNIGKSDASGNKTAGDIYVQDFFVSYAQSKAFNFDMGMLLIPISRNSTQSAATHLASDYGPYSFLNSGPTQSRVGRDYGVQARGYLADSKFEYRFGVYDGFRGTDASNSLRYAGRVMFHVFDPEPGMFYTGNNLGAKHALSFGASFDVQDDYQAIGGDVFYDQPVGSGGSAFTFQADYIQYDGGDFFTALPKQDTYLVEVGYLFGASKIQPWIQYADRDFADAARADQSQTWLGVNYRIAKHNRVLRFAYGQLEQTGAPDRDVFQVTMQFLQF